MNEQSNRTYLLVGHVTKDLLPNNKSTTGGTVTYASVVAKQLGWHPVVVTAADAEFVPPEYLTDVEWHVLPSPVTTTFHNQYDYEGNRRQTVSAIARVITAVDIPAHRRQAAIVHLCPLTQELTPEITTAFTSSQLMSTPQGWMRQWDDQGIVSLGDWRGANDILPKLTAAVISLEDIEGQWTIAEAWATRIPILVVTLGEEGCIVLHQGRREVIPPRPAHPIDPTGAGDVFAAAFFIELFESGSLWHAARFANVTASMAIERPGPEGAPSRDEVEAYLGQGVG